MTTTRTRARLPRRKAGVEQVYPTRKTGAASRVGKREGAVTESGRVGCRFGTRMARLGAECGHTRQQEPLESEGNAACERPWPVLFLCVFCGSLGICWGFVDLCKMMRKRSRPDFVPRWSWNCGCVRARLLPSPAMVQSDTHLYTMQNVATRNSRKANTAT